MQDQDFQALEKKAGSQAASSLRAAFRSEIKSTFKRRSGKLEKSNVSPRYRDGQLDRLVLSSPRYSFQSHFGSNKTGDTSETTRAGSNVRPFRRRRKDSGVSHDVKSFYRSGTKVDSHDKKMKYKSYNHLSAALRKSQSALEKLATDLSENRAVEIMSKIKF